MPRTSGRIRAHTISPTGKPALRLELQTLRTHAPGQPYLAYLSGSRAPVRTVLYPSILHDDGFTSVNIPSPAWTVGSHVDLLGPIGKGFSPPSRSRRWFLVALGQPLDRLLPLIDTAIASGISIAAFAEKPLPELPEQVEIAADPADIREWADYIAVDSHVERIVEITELLAPRAGLISAVRIETLLETSLPCGFGVCAACSVNLGNSWGLACQDGPVFNLGDWGS